MNHFSSPGCRVLPAVVFGLVLGLGCAAPVLAQSFPLKGRWLLDPSSEEPASHPILTIADGRMTWTGTTRSVPPCVQQFVVKKENPGTVYTDGNGTRFVAGVPGSIPTYLLTLNTSTCGGAGEDVRIRFPLVYDTDHIDIIEYANGKPLSTRRFHRKK